MKKLILNVISKLNSPENDFSNFEYKKVTETIKTFFC